MLQGQHGVAEVNHQMMSVIRIMIPQTVCDDICDQSVVEEHMKDT